MARSTMLFLLAPLALAACDGGKTVSETNASPAEVAEAAKGAVKLQPGQWRVAVSVDKIDAPDAPPQVAAGLQQAMARPMPAVEACVTPEQAERPPQTMFGGNAAEGCTYETFELSGGTLNAVMSCKAGAMAPGAGPVRTVLTGKYEATAYDIGAQTQIEAAGQKMTVHTKVKGTRLGECPAGAAAGPAPTVQ